MRAENSLRIPRPLCVKIDKRAGNDPREALQGNVPKSVTVRRSMDLKRFSRGVKGQILPESSEDGSLCQPLGTLWFCLHATSLAACPFGSPLVEYAQIRDCHECELAELALHSTANCRSPSALLQVSLRRCNFCAIR